MAKAKSTVSEKIQKKANGLRQTSKFIRSAKTDMAKEFVSGFTEGALSATDLYTGVLEVYLHGLKATRTIFAEIESNPKFRAQVETFVANIIEDVAARSNEFANVMDSVANSPKIQDAIEEAKLAIEGIGKHLGSVRGFGKRRKFSVVRDEDAPEKKSASTRKSKK
jgi:5-bromo-4-chloroindolyl phosphate hydrolysis protein